MQSFLQNLRFSLRLLRKAPGFTIAVILTLALGIGATTAIYTAVYATLIANMPYPKPDEVVMVWSTINGHCLHASRRYSTMVRPGPSSIGTWNRALREYTPS